MSRKQERRPVTSVPRPKKDRQPKTSLNPVSRGTKFNVTVERKKRNGGFYYPTGK